MKNLILIVLAVLTLFSCRKNIDENIVTIVEDPAEVYVYSSLKGKVIDELGGGVVNAEVTFDDVVKYTDVDGNFYFERRLVKKRGSSVTAVSGEYFEGIKKTGFGGDGSSYVQIQLINKGEPEIIPSTGGTFTSNDNMTFTVPENGMVDENGDPYDGDVKIYTKLLDPTEENIGSLMPGDLTAKDEAGNLLVLTSYGILAFEMEGENGEALVLADGKSVEGEMPIPGDLLSGAPDEIGFWYYDLDEEQWLNSGTCPRVSSIYRCTLFSSGYYNCGEALPGICLSGTVYNSDSTESAYLKVIVRDLTDNFNYWGYTDSLGYFCGSVPQGVPLKLILKDHCDNTVYVMDVGPYAQDFTLPDIYLDFVVQEYLINIQGIIEHCTSNDLPSGHIAVWYPGKVRIIPYVDGTLDEFIAFNCVLFPELRMKVFTNEEEMSSIDIIHNNFSDVDLGTLNMCESLTDYFHLDVEGTPYWASPSQFYLKSNTNTPTMVLEAFTTTGLFEIEISDYAGEGTYNTNNTFDTSTESVAPYPTLTSQSPDITVQITSDDGTYIEGTISGTAQDSNNVTQNISGDFKILIRP